MYIGIRRGVAAGLGLAGFLGAGYLIYKHKDRLYIATVAAAQVLIFGAATSAAVIAGKFIGFGPQLGLVVDRLTLVTDLVFFTFVIGGCYAPLVVELVIFGLKAADDNAKPEPEQPKGVAYLYSSAKSLFVAERRAEATPRDFRRLATLPLILLLAAASFSSLGTTHGAIFGAAVLITLVVGWALDSLPMRVLAIACCATFFGYLQATHLRSEPADTKIVLNGGHAPVVGKVVMSTNQGIVALKDQKLVLVPWLLVTSIEVATPAAPTSGLMPASLDTAWTQLTSSISEPLRGFCGSATVSVSR